ncbi:MAG: TonB family protein [Methyloprofundus sp.]|nr:TonB family protein [Methyloprofundus sp.]
MISNDQQSLKPTDNIRMTEFIRTKRDSKIQNKERIAPEKPKPKERPKQPKLPTQTTQVAKSTLPVMDIPNLDIPLNTRFNGSMLKGLKVATAGKGKVGKGRRVKLSTNIVPLVRIPPVYPRKAARRRIEGWVKVKFTISKKGRVKNPVIIASKPKSIFNRAALKAIKRWKFKPHILNGEAQEQQAIQTLDFKLPR